LLDPFAILFTLRQYEKAEAAPDIVADIQRMRAQRSLEA
jgi:hypothetical protein